MFKSKIFSLFFLLMIFMKPAFSAETSIDRLIMFHDLMPNEALQTDAELDRYAQASETKPTNFVPLTQRQKPIRVLIDVRSNHSDGEHDFQTLIDLAKARHIDAMAFTEHDRYTIRFGIDPVAYLFGYSQEHPSLYQTGLEQFFTDLNQVQQQHGLTLFAGTESTPGYHWQGIPFKNLSLHQAERHLITLGVKNAEQIKALPSYDLRHAHGNKELSLIFWFVFIFMLIFTLIRKRKLSIALLVAGSFIAFMATWLMRPEVNPDADFIRSAHEQDLFVIWTHPGTLSGVRQGPMGVQLNTPPYNKLVFELPADAFAAVYGDTDRNTEPAGLWDRYMMDYMQGYHSKPIWAVAAGDYHAEGQANEFLGNFPMDVWAESAAEEDILAALKQGRMTSWQMQKHQHIATKALFLEYTDAETGQAKQLSTGDESVVSSQVHAVVALRDLDYAAQALSLHGQWIVDGQVAAQVVLSTADKDVAEATELNLSQGRHVIRFRIPPQQGLRMESNPFLVQVRK